MPIHVYSDALSSQLHVAPFNLTQLYGHRRVNFVHFPKSFSETCRNSTKEYLQLLVLVLSYPGNKAARDSIRKLWGSPEISRGIREGKVKIYFLNGQKTKSQMRQEIAKHDDIIIIDVDDSYQNLVYKSFSVLHIAAHICPSLFTLKVDEDTVFHIYRFLERIYSHFFHENADIYCYVWEKSPVERSVSSQWYVSRDQFEFEKYPNFCSGPAYAITRRAAKQILDKTHMFPDIQVYNFNSPRAF
ncbi:hypothetical protein PENTCL1PPCAC_29841 [Pristionchus entomophagus]|uniref:Hexosyltransferase n=1 Tax=Pristionchus entomophagus TaxID=358040 RepID=A0AAV5UM52_9BILA|nr:hypothetical protein PENTCL1PPCAC_29841 [Pristionchus entomophagus]